jgi:hypothetical protein
MSPRPSNAEVAKERGVSECLVWAARQLGIGKEVQEALIDGHGVERDGQQVLPGGRPADRLMSDVLEVLGEPTTGGPPFMLDEEKARRLAEAVGWKPSRPQPARPQNGAVPRTRQVEREVARLPRKHLAAVPDKEQAPRIIWQPLAEVQMRSIVFLDPPLLQADAFHLLAGRKGVGKGTVLVEIAARVTRGELGEKRRVVWIGSEDSAAIDIKPRVVAADGDPERILIVKHGWVQLPGDIGEIETAIADFGEVGMLVIDPVGNHITGRQSNAETDIRDAISELNKVADDHRCMVFGVRHLTEKECSAGVLDAILGSSAWVHVPRSVLAVVRDDDDPQISHLQCVAGNRLPPGTPGRMFRIEGVLLPGLENEVTRAVWIGDSTKDVETLLAASSKSPSKSDEAAELLLDILENEGEQESDALDARVASEIGIATKTVRNVRTTKLGPNGLGLVKSRPERDELSAITHWLVYRTAAPRP